MSACCSTNLLSSSSNLARVPPTFSSRRPSPSRLSVVVPYSAAQEPDASKNSASLADTARLQAVQEAADRSTKQDVSREASALHPEVERKNETGGRSLTSLLAFDGAGPETINGRMAMVGFTWALVAEKLSGLTVMEQLFNPATSGILWFGAVVQIFTLASLIPLTKGETTEGRAWGPFSAHAELWNGRLAMIGFAALLVAEMVRAGPLLQS